MKLAREVKNLKADQRLNQTYKVKSYPYVNIPKDTLTLKRHEIDRLGIWATFLAHPHLNITKENITLKQHEIGVIYSFLQDNKVIFRTFNYCLSSKPYLLEKGRLVRKLVERHKSFAATYEFALVLKREILKIMKNISWVIEEYVKKLVPKPKIHFVLDAKPEEIMKRKKDLNPELVKCKRHHYLLYSYRERFTIIILTGH